MALRKKFHFEDGMSLISPPLLNFWGGTTDWYRPPWPGPVVAIWLSYLTTGGPGKECRTNKLPPTRIQERSKRERRRLSICPTNLLESSSLESILAEQCQARTPSKDPELQWLARDNLETNLITLKPETISHVAKQFSWVPCPSCSLPRCPFPIKSFALSAHVSQKIHLQVLDKSLPLSPGRDPPSRNSFPFHRGQWWTYQRAAVERIWRRFFGPVRMFSYN